MYAGIEDVTCGPQRENVWLDVLKLLVLLFGISETSPPTDTRYYISLVSRRSVVIFL